MTASSTKRPLLRRVLIVTGVLLVVAAVVVIVGLSFVPGGMSHLELSYRAIPSPEPLLPAGGSASSAQIPVENDSTPRTGASEPAAQPEEKLVLSYTIPQALLQREVAAIFPITEGVEGLLKLVLSNPRFVSDPDPAFLRLRVDIHAVMRDESGMQYPGFAVLRTQLRYNPGATTVALRQAELAEFQFTGEAAGPAEALRPVLEDELAAQMNGFVVFQLPKKSGWWMRNGMSFVKDVIVENHQVVVLLGL